MTWYFIYVSISHEKYKRNFEKVLILNMVTVITIIIMEEFQVWEQTFIFKCWAWHNKKDMFTHSVWYMKRQNTCLHKKEKSDTCLTTDHSIRSHLILRKFIIACFLFGWFSLCHNTYNISELLKQNWGVVPLTLMKSEVTKPV